MNLFAKIKKAAKRTVAVGLTAIMAATCIDAGVLSASAASSSTLSNSERGVIFANTRSDFRDESIYFVMTTRFYNGDTSNDVQCWEVNQETGGYKGSYEADDPAWRGDFKGLIEKLDYIKALGFTAIWITPVVENCSGYDYHGYHAINFKKVDPRYESNDCKYQDLIDAAHAKDIKIIQDVVYNHTGNFGETNLFPMFKKEGDLSSPSCLVKTTNGLPANYDSLDPKSQYDARLALLKNTDNQNHDVNNIYHHYGHFNWDDYTATIGQIDGDCVDLNTENPLVYKYLVEAYSQYIDMGVDAFRVDTVRHISRLTLNKAFNQQLLAASEKSRSKRNGYDFFMFGEVCCRYSTIWYREHPCISTPYYTWKSTGNYAWSDDPAQWETNYDSAIQECLDNTDNISAQPTSTNAFLNGNNYHTPDYSQYSGLSVIDFPMHWNFKEASGAFNIAKSGDKYYNDATWNITYVDSHDYAPDHAPEDERFAQDQSTWAENLSLIFTFRGIPCIYYGSEIEFQKGCPIDKGATAKLSTTGRAYYGEHLEGNIVASDFTVFNASGAVAETLKHPLAQHIIRLNRIRQAVPALRKGQYSTEGCSGSFAFKRRYTDADTDSFALVTISGSSTFSGIPNGTYVDAVTGDTKTVSNGTLAASCSGKGNLRVYVLSTSKTPAPGRVIPNGKYLTDGGTATEIGNENVNIVEPTGITLDSSSVSVREAETVSVKATVAPSNVTNRTVKWTSSNTAVATVSGGTITGIAPGTATITATTYDGKYNATCKVTVTTNSDIVKPTGISVSPTSLELMEGETGNLTATVKPTNATNKTVTWTSSNKSVATVNAAGVVSAVGEGTATITASSFNGYSGTATVSVTPKQFKTIEHGIYFEKPADWSDAYVYFFRNNADVGPGWPGTKMTDMGDNIYCYEYTDSTSGLMLVLNNGNNGKKTSDLEYVDCGYYTSAGYKKTIPYNQDVAVTSVSVSKNSVTLNKGETASVTASVAPSNASNKTITWSSSDTSVATVSGGVITAVAAGTATITARSNNGKTATVAVTVNDDVTDELVNNSKVSSTSVNVGDKVTLTAKASGGTEPYTYALQYKKSSSSTWSTIGTKYGTESTGSFKPGSAVNYDVKISIKDSAGTVKAKTFTVKVGNSDPLVNNSKVSSTSVSVGDKVTLTAKASGGTAPYTYALLYKKSTASSWSKIGEKYGTTSTGSFKPSKAVDYDVQINVKDSTGTIKSKKFTVKVSASDPLTNNSTVSSTSVKVGDSVMLTAKASGGSAPYTYALLYKKSSASTWSKIGEKYGTTSTGSFKPSKAVDYDVQINVKDSAGTIKSKKFTVKVSESGGTTGGVLTNNSTVSSTSVAKGTKVTITGKASGGTSPYLYTYLYKKSSATTWTAIGSQYSSATSASFTPGSAVNYDVQVKILDGNGETVFKSFVIKVS